MQQGLIQTGQHCMCGKESDKMDKWVKTKEDRILNLDGHLFAVRLAS